MNRQQLLRRVETAWLAFNEWYAGLPDPLPTEPGVTGHWSVKDILAHVSTWEEETLKYLPVIASGDRAPRYASQGGIDVFNAHAWEQKQSLLLDEVRREMDETHRRLTVFLEGTPEEHFATETRRRRLRLRYDTYGHYAEHAEAIREWRDRLTR